MYHDEQHRIYPGHPLYKWCDKACHDATNLRNATRFRQRNLFTGLQKRADERHPLEQQVIDELEKTIPMMNDAHRRKVLEKWDEEKDGEPPVPDDIPDKYAMLDADNPLANYNLLVGMMTHMDNPDYNTDALCANACQQLIRVSAKDMKGFFKSLGKYKENPEKFTGRPEMPGYLRKGSATTAVFSSDGVHYNEHVDKDGSACYYSLTLPKAPVPLRLGKHLPPGRVKEIRVVPCFGFFIIHICTEDGLESPQVASRSHRVAAIDLGVDNLAAMVNNCGLPCFLYKGTTLKSDNQLYNKEMASIQSEQTKGGEEKFHMTEEAEKAVDHRNNRIRDNLLKTSKRIVDWCVENRIDTLIVGLNRGWKQGVEIGKVNNQSFVSIPHSYFASMLKWRCERAGIIYIEVEESYTSKASFMDGDFIPTYGDKKPKGGWKFGGHRTPTTKYYKHDDTGKLVEYKVKPRGLYKSRKHGIVNSDLNGAANILCKVFPKACSWKGCGVPDFSNVVVVSHPDEAYDKANRDKQISECLVGPSRSKLRRLKKKYGKGKCSPSGIGLCG